MPRQSRKVKKRTNLPLDRRFVLFIYFSNFSAATSKNFTLDQAVPPFADGVNVFTKTGLF